jgi:NTP pyrophosphatase (non-canonical NTP hydrolase)
MNKMRQKQQELSQTQKDFIACFDEVSLQAHQNAKRKGFWDEQDDEILNDTNRLFCSIAIESCSIQSKKKGKKVKLLYRYEDLHVLSNDKKLIFQKLGLIVTEVVEASEVLLLYWGAKEHGINRQAKEYQEKFLEEVADIIIRSMDLAFYIGGSLGEAIIRKAKANLKRMHKHGGQF